VPAPYDIYAQEQIKREVKFNDECPSVIEEDPEKGLKSIFSLKKKIASNLRTII